MDAYHFSDEARLYDELDVDNGWVAGSGSVDSREQELDEDGAVEEDDAGDEG